MNITLTEQNVDAEILHFLPLLGQEEKSSLLSVIRSFVALHKRADTPETEEAYSRMLDERDAAIESGEGVAHKTVMEELHQWMR